MTQCLILVSRVMIPAGIGRFSFLCFVLVFRSTSCFPGTRESALLHGCDSGFGHAVAHKFDAMGFQVIASVLDIGSAGAKELRRSCSARLTLVQMDLTKSDDIQKALQLTKTLTVETGLWALINNAGVCVHFGNAELSLMSTYRGCMEVNFFGTLEITQAFLPLLRRSKGRIVTVSSPAGDHSFPFLAAYGSSKAALNRVMDTFRHELKPWGIKVCQIQPGCFKTGRSNDLSSWEHQHKHQLANLSEEVLEDYGEEYLSETIRLFMEFDRTACEDLSPVVDSITDAVLSEHPKHLYFAGKGLRIMYFIGDYMPFPISDGFFRAMFLNNTVLPRALRKQCSKRGE
ncbi:11-beta-hydroxysteroid dehydrogenase type 2 isoform X2 [Ambystoma mexicanum]|uniref:11-beta-hydroxysteroid dehydrogenase type 2 isoform X2 n=1 Tax=Ambystoma mexicanum TaxID=8296 RepID=UPI0037E818E2